MNNEDFSLDSFFSDEPKVSAKDKAFDRFATMMIKMIDTLQSDWKKPWFTDAPSEMPKNLDGRLYNGMNAFMLLVECIDKGYSCPVFVTYERVTSLNYTDKKKDGEKRTRATDKDGVELPYVSVNKDEKSFPVFLTTFYIRHKETKKRITMDDYRKLSNDEQAEYNVYPSMNVYNVFNVSQTNIETARPELWAKLMAGNGDKKPKKNEDDMFVFPAFDDMVETQGWYCPIHLEHQDRAFYSPSSDSITLPTKVQFETGEAFYSTAIHEIAHSTGHADRLNRDCITGAVKFGSEDYGKEELIAEMTAAIVCHNYGFDNGIQKESAAYLKGWLHNLKADPSYIKDVLIDVRKASAMITNRIDKIA